MLRFRLAEALPGVPYLPISDFQLSLESKHSSTEEDWALFDSKVVSERVLTYIYVCVRKRASEQENEVLAAVKMKVAYTTIAMRKRWTRKTKRRRRRRRR